jgi:DNA-binding response OmpR family regulator
MADFDDVVVKPYRLDDLLKKMETLILQRGEQVDTPAQRRRAKG